MGISNDDRKGYGRHGIRAQHGDAQRQNASVQPTHVVRSDIQSPYVEKPGGGRPSSKKRASSSHRESQVVPKATAKQNRSGAESPVTQYSRSNSSYSHVAKKKMGRGKKIAIGIAAALLLIFAGVGTAAALYINSINSALSFEDEGEARELKEALVPVQNEDDSFYVMLLGSDARGDEASRSDVNILLRVDPTKGQLTMVSIPRDTKVEIEGYGTQKINAAYAYGGASLAVETVSDFAGVSISHYAEIHFDELISLIDTLGGVEVEVPVAIHDENAGGSIEAGLQLLNGEQALVFARSRAYEDGDFTRTSNQRILLQAIIDKVLAMPATQLPGTIQSLAQCVTTDYNVNDIVALAQKFQSSGSLTMYSGMVPSSTAMIDGVSYVITDEAAWAEMMQVVDAGEDPAALIERLAASSKNEPTES